MRSLNEGQKLEYQVAQDRGKASAVDLKTL